MTESERDQLSDLQCELDEFESMARDIQGNVDSMQTCENLDDFWINVVALKEALKDMQKAIREFIQEHNQS
jgi:hypothetical protein